MCLAVYISSNSKLPLVAWDEAKRSFNVTPLSESESEVRSQFSSVNLVYAGTHIRCGCGFIKEGESGAELAQVQENYNRLAEYLLPLRNAGASIEIYSCWEGDQGATPEHREKLTLSVLQSPTFEFKEKAYYEIVLQRV